MESGLTREEKLTLKIAKPTPNTNKRNEVAGRQHVRHSSTQSIFRELHTDEPFLTQEKQDMLTLKRANPICGTDAEKLDTKEFDDQELALLQENMFLTKVLGTKLSEPTQEGHHYYMKHRTEKKFKCCHALGA